MSDWLRLLLGLEENEVPAGADSRLELTGLLRGSALWIAVLAVAAAVVLIVILYRSERDLGLFQRLVLGALRVLALAIVVFMLLDPRILTEIRREREAHTLVLFDGSGSMSQRDDYEGTERYAIESATGLDLDGPHSRAELALAAMERQSLLELLAERNRVRAFAFDESLRSLEKLDRSTVLPSSGEESRIGDAVRGALKQSATDLIAGLVIISDGRLNGGETIDRIAPDVALRGVPVHGVLVGKSRLPRNYSVTQLSGPEIAEPGYPLRLEARIEAAGLRGSFAVVLSRQRLEGGALENVEERTLDGKGLQFSTSVTFVDAIPEKGTYRYIVSIPPHPGEVEPDDNERDLTVAVSEDKCRVLLIAGTASYEYRFLRNFLIRDDGLQVSCWLSSAERGYPQDGDVVIREVPQGAEKLRAYDVVILLDPDPAILTTQVVEGLREFVTVQGGGLAYIAGEAHTPKLFSSRSAAKLVGILPVAPGPAAGPTVRAHTKPWRARPTRQGAEHPICRLRDDPAQNAGLWSLLPPFYFLMTAPCSLRPVATALLEREGGEIVAATQRSGAGYTVYLGTDDLWRWRAYRESGIHERFWAGVVRYLALGKKLAGSKEATLLSDRDRYTLGDEVVLEANLIDAERKPVISERLEVAVEMEPQAAPAGGTEDDAGKAPEPIASSIEAGASVRLNLLPITGRPGWYGGRFRPEAAGRHVARVQSAGTARATFSVISLSREWEDPTPDASTLEELARRTGGALVGLGDLARIAERIPDRRVSEVIGRSASTIWDSGPLLLIFSFLVILEWVLRKVWRLN